MGKRGIERFMGKIVVLPDTLCNQIAAGEVVERPAAVVKELVENSIDAGSRKISVTLLQGGRKEIRIVDNGTGMSHDDALLAMERHATSKLRSIEDLESIRSLGFRGEALPSIAAVSRFELITREPDTVAGVSIRIEGGVLRDVKEAGCPAGTMITVRDLFFNLPARRKFLRSVDTEMGHIGDQFLRLAMAHPGLHFQLMHQERTQYDFPRAGSAVERAAQVLGTELSAKLRPFSAETPSMRIHGLMSPPDLQRASGSSLFAYVNGRPVWDRMLHRAILSAYDTLLPKGRFPLVALFVEMSPTLVDVNVHPTKREVRFREPGEVLETVRNTIRGILESALFRPKASGVQPSGGARESFAAPRSQCTRETQIPLKDTFQDFPQHQRSASVSPAANAAPASSDPSFSAVAVHPSDLAVDGAASFPSGPVEPGQMPRTEVVSPPDGEPLFSRLPLLGQLANSYILLEASDGLVIIDQHAAHERIIYDRLNSGSSREVGQRLMRSVVLDLFPRQAATLRCRIEHLAKIGFEIEPFGGDSFVIHSVPAALSGHAPDALLRELVETSLEDESAPRFDLLSGLAKTAACHEAIRAGQKLRPEEIRFLLEDLDRTRFSATCPHGRPVWHKFKHAEIARLFLRT